MQKSVAIAMFGIIDDYRVRHSIAPVYSLREHVEEHVYAKRTVGKNKVAHN